jgi:hypothetical protein
MGHAKVGNMKKNSKRILVVVESRRHKGNDPFRPLSWYSQKGFKIIIRKDFEKDYGSKDIMTSSYILDHEPEASAGRNRTKNVRN